MKHTVWIWVLVLSILLSGCGMSLEGEYVWEEPHQFPNSPQVYQETVASDYITLYTVLSSAIKLGIRQVTVSVKDYDREALAEDMERISQHLMSTDPIAAYAVQEIRCTQGTSGNNPALAVEIDYSRDKAEIARIKRAGDLSAARELIGQSLNNCESGVVILIDVFSSVDFEQLVENYAMKWPEYVMECPQVTVNVFPDSGRSRVLELKFTYQTSRDALKNMQSQVAPIFASAELYVRGDGSVHEKYKQLYSFLMERFSYTLETSITPSYSLLRHGVGDSRAFANVYAAMCRWAGLECMVVSGTKQGESYFWNIVYDQGVYYHVDLLRSVQEGSFCQFADEQMSGYVWDYSAYPACGPREETDLPHWGEENFGAPN